MLHLKRLSNQRGDTIVEVILALAVLGVVLGGSVVLANRNTKSLQDSQEHAVAQRQAQSQIEYLKSYAATLDDISTDALLTSGQGFCMTVVEDAAHNKTIKPVAATDSTCTTSADTGAAYTMNVKLTSFGEGYIATASAKWEGLTTQDANVSTTYRIYSKVGAGISVEEGSSCPIGYAGVPCAKIPPQYNFTTSRIPNPAKLAVAPANCSQAAPTSFSGAAVTMEQQGSGGTVLGPKPTPALFKDLAVFGTYKATITAPAQYQICDGNTPVASKTIMLTANPSATYPTQINTKVLPVCTRITVRDADTPIYGPWYNVGHQPIYNDYQTGGDPIYGTAYSRGGLISSQPWGSGYYGYTENPHVEQTPYGPRWYEIWTLAGKDAAGRSYWLAFYANPYPIIIGYNPVVYHHDLVGYTPDDWRHDLIGWQQNYHQEWSCPS
jgi:Tfp pilus assembly protein PilV